MFKKQKITNHEYNPGDLYRIGVIDKTRKGTLSAIVFRNWEAAFNIATHRTDIYDLNDNEYFYAGLHEIGLLIKRNIVKSTVTKKDVYIDKLIYRDQIVYVAFNPENMYTIDKPSCEER
jgi:hypothetical protein